MKTLKSILCALFFFLALVKGYSQEHPFLIVKKNQYKALQDKANSNQQPFKMFKNVSVQRWNLPYADTNNAKFLENIATMVNYNIMAYIVDPNNKARYKDRLIELIGTGNRQLQAIETNANHRVFVGGTTALFNQIIALDIIYPDLNNNQRQTAENNIGRSVNWYRDNGGSRAWRLSVDGINLLWALYRGNQRDIDYWKNRYDYYLFDKSMTNDGSWGQSPGYVYARMHGNRISKFGCIDVMQHMGVQNYYNDPRMKQLFQWAASFALTPSGSYSKFGDTINNEYQLNRGTSMHYANVYGPTIGGMFRWNNNRDGNILGPQSFQATNYMILILRKLNQDKAVMPTSILKEQSGAALWDRTDSREALQGVVYSLKRDNPSESQFGHTMEDINSIDISAYGQHMITNAGGLYVGKNNQGSNYPGYTPANDRWFLAKYQNTVLIGGRTTHNQRHGGGLTDGLVGGNIEFATTAAGPAINNGSHLRTLHFIHPEANKSNGYFVVHDEVKPNKSGDRVDIQFQMNTKRNGTKAIKGNQEYEAPINGFIYDKFNTHDNTEKVSLFFTSNPKVNIVDSYKGIKRNVAERKTDNVRAEYKAKPDGYVRATTVIFPQDSKHKKPGISKISNSNYDGAIVSHSNNFKDYYIGSSPSKTNTYSNISFKASTIFYRKESGKTTKFSSTNGTIFRDTEGVDYGYESSRAVSIVLENNSGRIYTKNNVDVTFYKDKISGVKINGRDASITGTASNAVTVSIPKGRHNIELILGGSNTNVQAPYGGTPRNIPGTIEAEAFDTGGQGVAYNDTDAANNGPNVAREDEGVDIESRDGGQSVGWTASGEWLEYTVNADAGTYTVEARIATPQNGKSLVVKLDGTTLGTFDAPNTGGWAKFQTINIPNISITGGNNKVLRLEFANGGININWVKFNLTTPSNTAPTVSFLRPKTSDTFAVGDNLTVEATAADADGSIAKVELYFDNQLVSKSPQADTHIWWSKYDPLMTNLQQGNHTLKLVASDNLGKTTEAIMTISVGTNAGCTWNKQSGKANDIGAYGSHVYIIGTNGYLYKSNGNGGWTNPDRTKKLKRLDVAPNGDVWAIGEDNKFWQYKHPDGPWLDKTGTGIDVGIAGNTIYILGLDNKIRKYTGNGTYSTIASGKGKRIDVDGSGAPWVIGMDNKLYKWNGNRWETKGSPTISDIGIEPDGNQVVVTGTDQKIHLYEGNGKFRELPGKANQITVNSDEIPWIIDNNQDIFKRNCTASERNGVATDGDTNLTQKINLYPNPASGDHFMITLGESDTSYIRIYDARGRKVYQTQTNANSIRINRKELMHSGLYFVKIIQNKSSYAKKILLK